MGILQSGPDQKFGCTMRLETWHLARFLLICFTASAFLVEVSHPGRAAAMSRIECWGTQQSISCLRPADNKPGVR